MNTHRQLSPQTGHGSKKVAAWWSRKLHIRHWCPLKHIRRQLGMLQYLSRRQLAPSNRQVPRPHFWLGTFIDAAVVPDHTPDHSSPNTRGTMLKWPRTPGGSNVAMSTGLGQQYLIPWATPVGLTDSELNETWRRTGPARHDLQNTR